MSRTAKSKLKWRFYTGEIHNRYVDPRKFNRLHAPLGNTPHFEPEYQDYCVTLRPCAEGVNKDGERKAVLYCTENNNRFFDQDKNGFWNEQKPGYRPDAPTKNSGGWANYTIMANHGNLPCHLLVAHAWVESRYHYIVEQWDEKKSKMVSVCTKQVDHINGNPLNNNASNLEYVSSAENMRRRKITGRLKNKAGIDPKLLTPTLCKGIYTLPQADEDWVGEFIERYKYHCSKCPLELSVDAIRLCVADALDNVKSQIPNDQ